MNHEIKEHIKKSLKQGFRLDGRKIDEFRKLEIKTGFLSTAEGSARIKYGDGEVLAGIKMSLEKPYPDTPEDGVLMVNAELLPLSNPNFESGPPPIEAIEMSRVIDRGIREGRAMNTKKLCMKKGELVWMVAVDIVPLNYDGNLLDMGGIAALAALKTARFPTVNKDGTVDYHKLTNKTLELQEMPIPVTVCKIGDLFIVDPTDEEEKAIDARLTITTLDDNRICALQKGENSPLTMEDIDKMVSIAFQEAKKIRKQLSEVK